jgi:hypothetical protein
MFEFKFWLSKAMLIRMLTLDLDVEDRNYSHSAD